MNPYEECPQFEKCSCNICPLDPAINDKEAWEDDGKCKAEKPTRIRIASKYPELPMRGLNYREFRNKQRQEALTPAQREFIATRLEKARKIQQNRALKQASGQLVF